MAHTLHKRIGVALLGVILSIALWLPAAAYADDGEATRTFHQELVPSASVLRVGEQFTVDLVLTCETEDAFPMYAYACTIRVNTDLFSIDNIEKRTRVDAYVAAVDQGASGFSDVIINYKAKTLAGDTWKKSETVITLTLTPKALGSTLMEFRRTNVSNHTGMKRMPCAYENLTQDVTDYALPAVKAQQELLTPASGFAVVEYVRPVGEGQVPCYKSQPFVWDGSRFVALIKDQEFSAVVSTDFSLVEGSADTFVLGDANGNGMMNIVDAQVAYEVARGVYTDFSILSQAGWLACDYSPDGVVDAVDAFAIQKAIMEAPQTA